MTNVRISNLGFGISWAIAVGVAACQGYVFTEEQKTQTGTVRTVIPVETVVKNDILFVVDNSGSMSQEQANLARNFAAFIDEVLRGESDFHIGVVTTDVTGAPLHECAGGVCANSSLDCVEAVAASGATRPGGRYCTKECETDADCPDYSCDGGGCTPSVCGVVAGFGAGRTYCYPANNGRLRAASCLSGTCEHPGAHEKVLTGALLDELGDYAFQAMFRDNVKVGTNGTGFEKGLAAVRNALDPGYRDPVTGKNLVDRENAGFLRPQAVLTVVVLADEDDCTHDPLDPGFDEQSGLQCYPSPVTCHPDCSPGDPDAGCGFDDPVQNPDSRYANLTPTAEFVEFLKNLKRDNKGRPRPEDVNMAVIGGVRTDGSGVPGNCWSTDGVACAGTRYHEVASGLAESYSASICQAEFKDTLLEIVRRLIISNERALPDEPADPSCIEVKIGGETVAPCEVASSCEPPGNEADVGMGCPGSGGLCWRYKPASCHDGGGPAVVLEGCGLEPGDKLEIDYLSKGTSADGARGGCRRE